MPGHGAGTTNIQFQKACTPNDSNSHHVPSSLNATHANGTRYSNAVMVATDGDVTVVLTDGTTSVLPALKAGGWHACAPFEHVRDTGTTATVALVGATYK